MPETNTTTRYRWPSRHLILFRLWVLATAAPCLIAAINGQPWIGGIGLAWSTLIGMTVERIVIVR